jgi:hypothetical protein
MSAADLGESLVGAYLRHIEGCQVVFYNSFLSHTQGEIDVVGVKSVPGQNRKIVFICEVTTHIGGMLITHRGKSDTNTVVKSKLGRLREFALLTFEGEDIRYQWWSPVVPVGKTTDGFAQRIKEADENGESVQFIYNAEYAQRVQALADHARTNSSTTAEPAYRMLQILTHLRGGTVTL